MSMFRKAERKNAKLRMLISGIAGSGKTWTSLKVARGLVGPNGRIAVVDSENESAEKYAGIGPNECEFDVLPLMQFSPENYIAAIQAAENEGYSIVILDSISHEWTGKGGCLELVDIETTRSNSGNSYFAWKIVTPRHNAFLNAIVRSKIHVIATARTESEYVVETNDKGKQVPRKLGMGVVQRKFVEFEFDIHADMNERNVMLVKKTRCFELAQAVIDKPREPLGELLAAWLNSGSAEQALASRLSPELCRDLSEAFAAAKMNSEQVANALKKRNVAEIYDLTDEQARTLIANIEAKIQGKAAASPQPVPVAAEVPPPISVVESANETPPVAPETPEASVESPGATSDATDVVATPGTNEELVETLQSALDAIDADDPENLVIPPHVRPESPPKPPRSRKAKEAV